jgi:hypothetical protein
MPGKTIGTALNNGFAGSYARQPDMIIETRPNADTANIVFGSPLMVSGGGVINTTAALTAATFAGVAAKEVKSALNYTNQNSGGEYLPNEPVSVFQRGSINVLCPNGTPALGGAVYVRTVAVSGKNVGDFETATDSGKNVLITNAQWGGAKDANNVAELVLLTRANA